VFKVLLDIQNDLNGLVNWKYAEKNEFEVALRQNKSANDVGYV
jgi:hypothetical protein